MARQPAISRSLWAAIPFLATRSQVDFLGDGPPPSGHFHSRQGSRSPSESSKASRSHQSRTSKASSHSSNSGAKTSSLSAAQQKSQSSRRWQALANAGACARHCHATNAADSQGALTVPISGIDSDYIAAEQKLLLAVVEYENMPLYTSRYAIQDDDGVWCNVSSD